MMTRKSYFNDDDLSSYFLERGLYMGKENLEVRKSARAAGVPLWAIAKTIGVSEPTLTRWLRFPLPEDKERRIMAAIAALSQEVS